MNQEHPELNVADLDLPLDRGTTLIEASAGTGKTYTLAALFLRLILEHGLEVGEILVTTFTIPATAELRSRIRGLLRAAHDAFAAGASDDPLLGAVLEHFADRSEATRERLAQALNSFDGAAIHTIHGFCQRMLQDRAFESGASFDQELLTNEDHLIREVAEDFWRRQFYDCEVCLAAAASVKKMGPHTFAALLKERLQHPLAEIIPPFSSTRAKEIQSALSALLHRLQAAWRRDAEEIRVFFLKKNAWAIGVHGKEDVMRGHLESVEECLADLGSLHGFHSLRFFSRMAIEAGTSKRADPPQHEFFDLCEELDKLCICFSLSLQLEFLQWGPAELSRRKSQSNVVSYTDLLTRLHEGLAGERDGSLATAIRGRFKAALIDEFQDTDSLQDDIFRTIFAGDETWLFLIGDPKQAIYSFRSADVFTYLNAADRADQRYTLGTNYRSSAALVEGTNLLFQRPAPDRSFINERIRFHAVKSSGKNENDLFAGDGISAPLRIWAFASDGKENKGDSCEAIVIATAAEIARLLQPDTVPGARLGERTVIPSDIAVLTRTNDEALEILRALQALGVPGVVLSNGSVIKSLEARELLTVLAAVARPRDEARVRAALLTDIFGVTANGIHTAAEDETQWEEQLLRFVAWHELWNSKGFIQMYRRLLLDADVRARVLTHPDGERTFTNLLHLGELLQQAAIANNASPGGLLKWLAKQISDPAHTTQEQHEMRLERDDDAVRIVTVHKSKGLEYNIVFCPFLWSRRVNKGESGFRFHDSREHWKLTLDLGSEEVAAHGVIANEEDLAEHARLVYVAMTRARQRCDLAWGLFKGVHHSAAAWLLHGPNGETASVAGTLKDRIGSLSETECRAQLASIASESNGSIQIVEPNDSPAPRYFVPQEVAGKAKPRRFRGTIERDWTVSSFSSLTEHHDAETPDRDPRAEASVELDEREPEGIHALLGGARTGNCLHEVLQVLNFSHPADLERLVERKLKAFSFDAKLWKAPVVDCIKRALAVKLAPGFSLGDLAPSACLTELEFTLPIGRLDAGALAELMASEVGKLEFSPRRGWLKGFIDLVFERDGRYYIADWKSNRLGTHAGAYTQTALAEAMSARHYPLQYHLYTVALHRYLRWRIPGYEYDSHFGGVFYVFLRGVEPARPELGIIHRRPTLATVEGLDRWLTATP